MTIARPAHFFGIQPKELSFVMESSIVLISDRVWLDLRCDSGQWYASLRIKAPAGGLHQQDGVNGFTDVWNGPHATRDAAMSNGYSYGRHQAIAHHVTMANDLQRYMWTYFKS